MKFDIAPTWERLQSMINGFLALVPNLILAFLLFALFLVLAKWIRALIHRFFLHHGHQTSVGILIGRVGSALVYLVGMLVSLSIILPSFKAADLIQVLGLGSVAIGFAFRDVLQNFLAGILILLAQPFRIGEEISVDGKEGVVEEIQARATLLRTSDGFLVVIPNTTIYTETITIFNAYGKRRSTINLVIGREADPTEAIQLILAIIHRTAGVLQDPPPKSVVTEINERGINIQVLWWTASRQTDYQAISSEVITAIKQTLTEHRINLPYPIQRVITETASAERNSSPTATSPPLKAESIAEAAPAKTR